MSTALICSCINNFPDRGPHPVATPKNLLYFNDEYAWSCVQRAKASGQANAKTQALLDDLTEEMVDDIMHPENALLRS